jgi:putative peptidoglycan lipid II flippase
MFAVGSMLVNVALAAALVGPLEVRGLALALSAATVVEFLALYAAIARRVPGLIDGQMRVSLTRMAAGCGVMATAAVGVYALLDLGAGLEVERGVEALVVVAAASSAGAAVYLGVTYAWGLEEPRVLLRRLRRQIPRVM